MVLVGCNCLFVDVFYCALDKGLGVNSVVLCYCDLLCLCGFGGILCLCCWVAWIWIGLFDVVCVLDWRADYCLCLLVVCW